RRGRSAVGQVHDGKHIGFTKGEIQGLQFAAESLNQRFRDLTSLGAAILQNALPPLPGLRHHKQILRHDALQSDVTSSSTSVHSLEPYTQSSRALSAGDGTSVRWSRASTRRDGWRTLSSQNPRGGLECKA